jgi:hypothetical protein
VRIVFRSLVLLNALVLQCGIASAQIGIQKPLASAPIAGPTFEESTKWITEKINAVSYRYYNEREPANPTASKYTFDAQFNGCQLKVIRRQFMPAGYGQPDRSHYQIRTVDVVRLNPDAIEVEELRGRTSEVGENEGFTRLWIWVNGKQNDVLFEQRPVRENFPDQKESNVALYFQGRELAERMKNAMQHTIKLCVQQAAAKKTAEPPRPKEIF